LRWRRESCRRLPQGDRMCSRNVRGGRQSAEARLPLSGTRTPAAAQAPPCAVRRLDPCREGERQEE